MSISMTCLWRVRDRNAVPLFADDDLADEIEERADLAPDDAEET
jgi:hypothetical protein